MEVLAALVTMAIILVKDAISATVAFILRPRQLGRQKRLMQQRHHLVFLHSLTDADKKWVREQLRQMGIRKMPYWLTPNPTPATKPRCGSLKKSGEDVWRC